MKLIKFSLLFIILLLTSCAFLLKSAEIDKEKLLYEHLQFWENIRIDGIIEANYKSYVFRKNITIKKNSSALRIDIYDSGIFGMQPTPFISAYYDSVLTIRTPDQQINLLNYGNKEEFDLSILFELADLFTNKDEIIKHQKLNYKDAIIIFSADMKISEIRNNANSSKITFIYLQDLDSIVFQKEEKKIINIQIDKITHPNEEINKLK
ncbi:MAG: hypothetical protein J7K29_03650 [Candidatus Cloacimonetes bacterium]|nr:hypothetical protein [Candidatus Cloacimonadota bacterium]